MRNGIFKHACVRDLAWAGFSEPMILAPGIEGSGLEYSGFWRNHLAALDREPAPLISFLAEYRDERLGIYYEGLWHYLLEHDPDTEFLAHNLPVRENGRTVGEFDCLYWCRRRLSHIHLELAVKFYLGVAVRAYWLGPGGSDRLDAKLQHLARRQSQLAAHPAARKSLSALGISECRSLVDIKGYLFAPVDGMPPPPGHNAANTMQHWYSLEQFADLEPLHPDWVGWQEIPRRRWLSPYLANEGNLRDSDELLAMLGERLAGGARPVQLAACDELGIEQHRCFVTPVDWPE
jgi:hypothetical protein